MLSFVGSCRRFPTGRDRERKVADQEASAADSPLRLSSLPELDAAFTADSEDDEWFPLWVGSPSWSPDGKELYFATNRRGHDEVWRVGSSGGPESLVYDPRHGAALSLLGAGAWGELAIYTEGGLVLVDPRSGAERPTGVHTAHLFWSFGHRKMGVFDPMTNRLGIHDGRTWRWVSGLPQDYRISAVAGAWSPDGTRFATYVARPGLTAGGRRDSVLAVIDASGAGPRCVTTLLPPSGYAFDERLPLCWAGSTSVLAVLTQAGPPPTYETWAYEVSLR